MSFQVTDMMVANSHNLIVTVKPANQRNNVQHRGSKNSVGNTGSVGSTGSTGSALSHDSPSPASQSNPITARYHVGIFLQRKYSMLLNCFKEMNGLFGKAEKVNISTKS